MAKLILSAAVDYTCDNMPRLTSLLESGGVRHLEMRLTDGGRLDRAADIRHGLIAKGFKVFAATPSAPLIKRCRETVRAAYVLGVKYIDITAFIAKRSGVAAHSGAYGVAAPIIEQAAGMTCVFRNNKGDTPKKCLKLCEKAKGGLGLAFDPVAFVESGVSPREAYSQMEGYISYVHISDMTGEDLTESLLDRLARREMPDGEEIAAHIVLDAPSRFPSEPEDSISDQALLLRSLLCAGGFRQNKDTEGGFGIWTR